jgi:hypothetical protein
MEKKSYIVPFCWRTDGAFSDSNSFVLHLNQKDVEMIVNTSDVSTAMRKDLNWSFNYICLNVDAEVCDTDDDDHEIYEVKKGDYVEYEGDWRTDRVVAKVFPNTVYLYTKSKYDSSSQVESIGIPIEFFKSLK